MRRDTNPTREDRIRDKLLAIQMWAKQGWDYMSLGLEDKAKEDLERCQACIHQCKEMFEK